MMNILFTVAEAYPFAKTGGLGDIGGSLPKALCKLGNDVRVIMPKYATIPQELLSNIKHLNSFTISLGWRRQYCSLEELNLNGVHYYFIDNDYYFKRDKLYGYNDDAERFAFFSLAALESLTHMEDFQPEVIHCHDWHTALIPLLLKEYYLDNPFYYNLKSVFTIHNLKYQGIFSREVFEDILNNSSNGSVWEKPEFNGQINYMKAALISADLLTTVSPTYAKEIQETYFGEGLDKIIYQRKDQLFGILNGIDGLKYDPLNDPNLAVKYRSSLNKKKKNKTHLQSILNLPANENILLIGLISRLVDQKGLDLISHILEEMLSMDVQMVVLGTGEKKYEDLFSKYAADYPDKLAINLMFDEVLSHKIYGGADVLLMPSLFEPCGLSQMIGMRYSTVPIVRETGGLKDSVFPYNEHTGEGNGFSFANYNAHELLFTVQRAVKLYYDDNIAWKGLTENARKNDFSWEKSALKYLNLYESLAQPPLFSPITN